jgi:hypothetical protein
MPRRNSRRAILTFNNLSSQGESPTCGADGSSRVFWWVAVWLASAAFAQQVLTESGTVSGYLQRVECLQRDSVRSPAGGRLALARPGTFCAMDGHP